MAYPGNFRNQGAYDPNYPGPAPGKPMNVPVPSGMLKDTNDRYRNTVGVAPTPQYPPPPFGYPSQYVPYPQPQYPPYYPTQQYPYPQPYNPYPSSPFPVAPSAWFSSVNPGAPFVPIDPAWQRAGILTRVDQPNHSELLNLYRRPIAPLQEVWEYAAQDKNLFWLSLAAQRYLNDGDIVENVIGKGGPWRVHLMAGNKWSWV